MEIWCGIPTAATSSPISLPLDLSRGGPRPALALQIACLLTRYGLRGAVVVGGRGRRGGSGEEEERWR